MAATTTTPIMIFIIICCGSFPPDHTYLRGKCTVLLTVLIMDIANDPRTDMGLSIPSAESGLRVQGGEGEIGLLRENSCIIHTEIGSRPVPDTAGNKGFGILSAQDFRGRDIVMWVYQDPLKPCRGEGDISRGADRTCGGRPCPYTGQRQNSSDDHKEPFSVCRPSHDILPKQSEVP